MSVYLFVISSINHPVYRRIQKKRRRLLEHYGIPYTVLINHQEADVENTAEPTLVPIEEEEVFYNGGGYNPFMAQKFLMAVKMLFRSHKCFDDVPNYIIRTNATVYVHFPSLLAVLNGDDFPRKRVMAGVDYGVFVQGMVMVFSKDVLANILSDPRLYKKDIMRHNDDVSLTILADPYAERIDWTRHMCMMRQCPTNDKGVYKPKEIDKEKWMFRIYEAENDRHYDAVNWDALMQHFDEDKLISTTTTPPAPQEDKPKPCRRAVYYWLSFIMIVATALFYTLYTLHKPRPQPISTAHRQRLLKKMA